MMMKHKSHKKISFSYKDKLVWPVSVSRTKQRRISRSKASWLQGLKELQDIAAKIGIQSGTIYANIKVNRDLMICGRTSSDAGVCIHYRDINGIARMVYCDEYLSDTANLREIVKSLEAYYKIKYLKVGYLKIEEKPRTGRAVQQQK